MQVRDAVSREVKNLRAHQRTNDFFARHLPRQHAAGGQVERLLNISRFEFSAAQSSEAEAVRARRACGFSKC